MDYKIIDDTLKFIEGFNSPLDDYIDILKKYKKIKFNQEFNQDVSNIPDNIVHIDFGKHFNQNIDNLPFSVEYLHLRKNFNQPVDFLPPNLKVLILEGQFNQSINNLPEKLEVLIIGNKFSKSIDNLPDSIWLLAIGYWYDNEDHIIRSGMFLPIEFKIPITKLPKNIKFFFVHIYHPRTRELMEKFPDVKIGGKVLFHLDWMDIKF